MTGDLHDIGNYRPICLLSVVYNLFTRVILNSIHRTLNEGQPCERAGFGGVATVQNFTTRVSPIYNDINIDVKRGVRQGDTISPKLFIATLQNVMRTLEWDNLGVKIDGRQLHYLRFADGIVLITPNISQAERMLADFDIACENIGLRLNLTKTLLMENGLVSHAPFTLNGTNISECSSKIYLGREINFVNDLAQGLSRRRLSACGAFKSIDYIVKRTRNTQLSAHLFDSAVLSALTYELETSLRKQDEASLSLIERAVETTMLGVSRSAQVSDGIRSSDLRQRSKIKDAVLYAKQSKIRWAGHVKRMNGSRWARVISDCFPRDVKCTAGRPPTR
ncbi:unnamed protein product [Angiostrongylus costaricensis]|uniref:Reverse transcriptase domain-containing protein n=1 Tax=Angiostrongylus costaricensis TaxID=334426 RepID=A0A0R3Q2I0_ANGCS|nr:unnamed protein product [Angiostrongylus costaricensis]